MARFSSPLAIYPIASAAVLLCLQSLYAQAPANSRKIAMISVDGHTMRVETENLADRKSGQPVVVFESGAVQRLETWDPVFDRVGAIAPAIAYDRRGVGGSEFDGEPQTLKHVANSLHALLAEMKVAPPYVLTGHSYGGALIRVFAHEFPAEVKGLVYLESADVDMTYAEVDALSPNARRFFYVLAGDVPPNLPPGMQAEFENIVHLGQTDTAEAHSLRPPAGLPTAVVVGAGKYERGQNLAPPEIAAGLLRLQIKHQLEWALSSPQGLMLIARHSGHYVHQDDPALAVQAIRHVLAAATSGK
jgi:pimeloyl-ACP methyl ester carboxylesterase